MSASEKLKALKPEGLVVTDAPFEGYTDAVCLSLPAHAAVVAVVEAAEKFDAHQWVGECEGPDHAEHRMAAEHDARALVAALAALDEALS